MAFTLDDLVRSEARSLQGRVPAHVLPLEDLLGYGQIGLLEAQTRYDSRLGHHFETFARLRIRGAIIDGMRASGLLRRRGFEALRRQALAHEVIGDATPRPEATLAEDAAVVTTSVIDLAMAFLLEATVGTSPEPELDAESALSHHQVIERVRHAVDALEPTDREVLDAVYDLHERGDSGADLARRRGVSRSMISRAHQRVLDSLRSTFALVPC